MLKEGLKFGVVGAVSTTVDYLLLNLCLHFGMSLPWATFFGYCLGTINGYYFNNIWTYAHLKRKTGVSGLSKYAVISGIGLVLTELIVNIGHEQFDIRVNVIKTAAVIIVFFWNFFGNRLWTFKDKKETPQH
jgi:putative flippase GtrA